MQHLINIIKSTNINKYPNADLNNRLVFGLRGTDDNLTIGQFLEHSYGWVDNEKTDEKLPGTCACKLINAIEVDFFDDEKLSEMIEKIIKKTKSYGENIALVFGLDAQVIGNDDFNNEVVIDDCQVLSII